jgi:hypothetical protein
VGLFAISHPLASQAQWLKPQSQDELSPEALQLGCDEADEEKCATDNADDPVDDGLAFQIMAGLGAWPSAVAPVEAGYPSGRGRLVAWGGCCMVM